MYKYYDNNQKIFVVLVEDANSPKGSFARFLNDFIEKQVETKPFEIKRNNDKGWSEAYASCSPMQPWVGLRQNMLN